jgi:DNA modification methylase
VKPIAVMRWLERLVTPPGGLVLDPFAGSGTGGCAARLEGFRYVGIERDPEFVPIARARIAFWDEHGEQALERMTRRRAEATADSSQESLFDA